MIEGRSFKFTFSRLKAFIDEGSPVVAGALDMYYLHYYSDLYEKQHVPIHYVLVVGYDDENIMNGNMLFLCTIAATKMFRKYHMMSLRNLWTSKCQG